MASHAVLIRGINVGGRQILPMTELVAVLEDVGARQIRTYIQSGNAVFESAAGDCARLAAEIGAGINARRGFTPAVVVLERETLAKAVRDIPFAADAQDAKSVHLGFLACEPKQPDMDKLTALRRDSERFHLGDRVFYLYAPEGVGRSRLAAQAERLLGVPMTDRNLNTARKLMAMLDE